LQDPTTIPQDLSKIQVSSLKDPYWEIVWIFTRITSQDSTRLFLNFLYIFYILLCMKNVVFDCVKIISN
jgi:hypothetical protein